MRKVALLPGFALVFFFACGDCGGPTSAEDAGPTMDGGPPDAGPHDAGPTDAGPTDAGPADAGPTDAGPSDAGATDAGPTDYAPGFTGNYQGTYIDITFGRDGGFDPDGGVGSVMTGNSNVVVSYLAMNMVSVSTACGCRSDCVFWAVTPDATSLTLELQQPVSCGPPPTRVIAGSGAKDGGVLTLEFEGDRNYFYYRLRFERTFRGILTDLDGGP